MCFPGTSLLVVGICFWQASHLGAAPPDPASGLAPSVVALSGNLPLSEAIKRLEATGNRIVDLRPRLGQEVTDPLLPPGFPELPFWQALDRVADWADLRLVPHIDKKSGEPIVGLAARDKDVPPRQHPSPALGYSGPFRVAVKQLTATRNLDDPNQSGLTCVVQVACEPRLQPLLLRLGRGSITYDGKPVDQGGIGTVKALGEAAIELTVRLPLPARQVASLNFGGEFVALTPPSNLTFEFPRLAANEKVTLAQTTATLASFRSDRATQQWLFGITLDYPAGTLDLESHQTWAMERNKIWLRHQKTKTLLETKLNPEIGIDEGRSIHINYAFADVPGRPEDWELVYRAPAPPVAYPVRFAFSNLPLP
jgi:hypothetical protein